MIDLKFLIVLLIGCVISNAFVIETRDEGLPDSFYDVCKEDFSNCVGAWGKSTDEEGHPCLEFKNCTTIIAFEIVDEHYVFHTMTSLAGNKSYVALGFSADTGMGDDGVVECIIDNKSDEKPINIYLSYNEGHTTVRSKNQNGLEEVIATEENEYLYCKFNLTNSVQFNDLKVSLAGDEEYYLIGVSGVSKIDEDGTVIAGSHHGSRLVSDKPLFKIGGGENEVPNSFYDVCKKNSSYCLGANWVDDKADFSCVENKNCTTIAAFELVDGHYVFHTMVQLDEDTGYVALGFSADQKMGDDGVVECIKDDKPDKPVNTYLSSTKGHSVIRSSDQSGLEEVIAKEENNYLYCKFNLTNSLEINNLNFTLNGDEGYYLMVVSGGTKTDDDGNIVVGNHHDAIVISEEKLFTNDDGGNGNGGSGGDDDDNDTGSGHAVFAYSTLICASVVFTFSH